MDRQRQILGMWYYIPYCSLRLSGRSGSEIGYLLEY